MPVSVLITTRFYFGFSRVCPINFDRLEFIKHRVYFYDVGHECRVFQEIEPICRAPTQYLRVLLPGKLEHCEVDGIGSTWYNRCSEQVVVKALLVLSSVSLVHKYASISAFC
jgi:hypothetical protein